MENAEDKVQEAEMKIIAQEKNIADFKARIAKEKKEVKDDGQNKWISFKNEFNHDMDELGKAFKDLTVENIN